MRGWGSLEEGLKVGSRSFEFTAPAEVGIFLPTYVPIECPAFALGSTENEVIGHFSDSEGHFDSPRQHTGDYVSGFDVAEGHGDVPVGSLRRGDDASSGPRLEGLGEEGVDEASGGVVGDGFVGGEGRDYEGTLVLLD